MSDSSSLSELPSSPERLPPLVPLGPRGAVRRSAASIAAKNVKAQVASSESGSDMDDIARGESKAEDEEFVVRKGKRQRGASTVTLDRRASLPTAHHRAGYGKAAQKGRAFSSRFSRSVSSSHLDDHPEMPPRRSSRSRTSSSPLKLTQPVSDLAASLLGSSPLPSPTPSPKKTASPKKTPAKRRASSPPLPSTPSPSKRSRTATSVTNPPSSLSRVLSSPSKKPVDDTWSREKLEGVVWVRLNKGGNAVENTETETGGYWWPAKMKSETWQTPLVLELFGDQATVPSITLTTPSENNIMTFSPIASPPRFTLNTCHLVHPLLPDDTNRRALSRSASGSKPRLGKPFEKRWKSAFQQALAAHDEDLPDLEDAIYALPPSQVTGQTDDTLVSSSPTRKKQGKGKGKLMEAEDQTEEMEEEPVVDPGPDQDLEIPGEHVLARDKSKLYWPATVLKYDAPTSKKGRGKTGTYLVEYLDSDTSRLKREDFFSQDEDGFITCELGAFTGPDDVDDDVVVAREPSPESLPPVPTTLLELQSLSMHQRLRLVQNVLAWTIHSRYPPNVARCEAFYNGGRERKNLADYGTEMGTFETNEQQIIRKEIMYWALRESTVAKLGDLSEEAGGLDGVTAPLTEQETLVGDLPNEVDRDDAKDPQKTIQGATESPPRCSRPTGCEEYEALSESERVQFCTDVLVPEAARQLLAWQEGYRFVTPDLPPYSDRASLSEDVIEQEKELHSKAEQLAKIKPRGEWVDRLLGIRSSRLAVQQARGRIRQQPDPIAAKRAVGSSTRPNAGRKL